MTRSRHVTPSRSVRRIENLCALVNALQGGQLLRDEIGALLCVGPSGVRKYLVDLSDKVEISKDQGEQVCRWKADPVSTRAYLDSLAAQVVARPAKPARSALDIACQDPARHFHIMPDDEPFKVTPQRAIPAHHPLMAHFFNLVPTGAWA